jgi:hypothetical protein
MRRKPPNNESQDIGFGELDIYNLHLEWIKQDRLVGYYGAKLAKAKRKYEETHSACKVFEAETGRRIRRKPGRYGVKRLTEAAIKEVVATELLTSQEHENLIDSKYEVEMLEAAMRRLEHRKKALSDLVYLHSQQYFAQPTLPKYAKMRNKIQASREDELRGLKTKGEE